MRIRSKASVRFARVSLANSDAYHSLVGLCSMRGQLSHSFQCRALSLRDCRHITCRQTAIFRNQVLCRARLQGRSERLQTKVSCFSIYLYCWRRLFCMNLMSILCT